MNHSLSEYASYEIITEAALEIDSMTPPENHSASNLSQELWDKVLRYGKVYEDYRLKGIFYQIYGRDFPKQNEEGMGKSQFLIFIVIGPI